MRIKGKRARELLRLSYLSISSTDELSKLNSPLTKRKSLSRLSSQASVETEPSNTTINKGDDDDDYPRPPSTAPAPPPEHSSDNRIVSRRRTSPEVLLAPNTIDILNGKKRNKRSTLGPVSMSAVAVPDHPPPPGMSAVAVPDHPPPPGMPPPGMEMPGMTVKSWRMPAHFDVNAAFTAESVASPQQSQGDGRFRGERERGERSTCISQK